MAKIHEIGIGADTRAFEDNIKRGIIKPAEEAEKALQELGDTDAGTDAARDLEKVEDALKKGVTDSAEKAEKALKDLGDTDAGRDASRDLEKLEDQLRDAQKQTERMSDSMDDVGDKSRRAFDKAGEGAEEFKDEAKQSIKETAASFSDVTDAVDLVQEVAANAFSGFGPAGVAAGAAAAIGIGAAVSGFEAVNKAEQESRERAAEWADAYTEAGTKVLSAATTTARALDIATDAEKFKTAQENAKNWGVDVSVAIAAMAGESWALTAANEALSRSEKSAAEEAVKLSDGGEALADQLLGASGQARAGRDALDKLNGEMSLGAQQADAYSRYLVQMAEHTAGATTKVDEFGDSIVTLPDGKQIYIDAETGQATTDVDRIEDKIYGIKDKDVKITARTYVDDSAYKAFVQRMRDTTIKINGRVVTTWQ